MSEVAHTTPVRPPVSEEHRAEALRRVNRSPGQHWGLFLEWAKSFTIAIVLFLFVRTFLVEAFKIPSGSMEKTLLVGDFLLVNKMVYGAEVPFTGKHLPAIRHPQRGDVIVFQWPVDPSKNFVKRLVGIPGDTLMMSEGDLYVNGKRQAERYVSHSEPEADPTNASRRPRPQAAPHRRETTGVRWSSRRTSTSCSATIETTRSTAATGSSFLIRSFAVAPCSCITATTPTHSIECRG